MSHKINDMKKKKYIRESDLATFRQIRRWIKNQYKGDGPPIYVEKGTECSEPFRVWPFDDCLLMMASEKAKTPSQKIMNQADWETFCKVVKDNPGKGITELDGLVRKELGGSWRNFIPSFRHINRAYQQNKLK